MVTTSQVAVQKHDDKNVKCLTETSGYAFYRHGSVQNLTEPHLVKGLPFHEARDINESTGVRKQKSHGKSACNYCRQRICVHRMAQHASMSSSHYCTYHSKTIIRERQITGMNEQANLGNTPVVRHAGSS